MTSREPAEAPVGRGSRLACSVSSAVPLAGITAYGSGPDEAVMFQQVASGFGVRLTLTEAAVSEANVGLALGSRCVSVGHKTPVTSSTLLALKRTGVRYVSTRSVGCNHIDVTYAEQIGLRVGTVAYSPDSVADYTLMLMLMALRHAKAIIRRSDSHDYRLYDMRGRELRDLTVGIVGTGRIGTAVMDRLRGFGCRVLAYDIHPRGDARYAPLDDVLGNSDIVTLHTPLTPDTYHLLDRRRIAGLKPGAIVVNTGRGALVDTDALLAALDGGRLGGAALDVLEGEDGIFYADRSNTPIDNTELLRLQRLANVIISPHTAYYTDHALRDTVENTIRNCLAFEKENAAWTG